MFLYAIVEQILLYLCDLFVETSQQPAVSHDN